MTIEDFRIKIKKYDRINQVVISNVIVCDIIEIRGFVTRYAELKKSPYASQWIVSPPSVRMKGKSNKYFWIVNILDPELWHQLQEKIVQAVIDYTNH
jgi:hypothetical protein